MIGAFRGAMALGALSSGPAPLAIPARLHSLMRVSRETRSRRPTHTQYLSNQVLKVTRGHAGYSAGLSQRHRSEPR